jgi:hypothetical protein
MIPQHKTQDSSNKKHVEIQSKLSSTASVELRAKSPIPNQSILKPIHKTNNSASTNLTNKNDKSKEKNEEKKVHVLKINTATASLIIDQKEEEEKMHTKTIHETTLEPQDQVIKLEDIANMSIETHLETSKLNVEEEKNKKTTHKAHSSYFERITIKKVM